MIKQQAFHDDLDRYKKWKLSQVRYDVEFGITHAPAKDGSLDIKKIEEDEAISRKILTRIYKERKNKRVEFNPDQLQMQFLKGLNVDEEASDYQRRIT